MLKHVRPEVLFAMRPVWRGSVRIDVSSPAKTIIDMLDDPAIGGGIRHVADCLANISSARMRRADELLAIADQLGNRAVFKRLGFLAERLPGQQELAAACRERLSQGMAKLDPSAPCPRLVTRWRLWVPAVLDAGAGMIDRTEILRLASELGLHAARGRKGLRARLGAGRHRARRRAVARAGCSRAAPASRNASSRPTGFRRIWISRSPSRRSSIVIF